VHALGPWVGLGGTIVCRPLLYVHERPLHRPRATSHIPLTWPYRQYHHTCISRHSGAAALALDPPPLTRGRVLVHLTDVTNSFMPAAAGACPRPAHTTTTFSRMSIALPTVSLERLVVPKCTTRRSRRRRRGERARRHARRLALRPRPGEQPVSSYWMPRAQRRSPHESRLRHGFRGQGTSRITYHAHVKHVNPTTARLHRGQPRGGEAGALSGAEPRSGSAGRVCGARSSRHSKRKVGKRAGHAPTRTGTTNTPSLSSLSASHARRRPGRCSACWLMPEAWWVQLHIATRVASPAAPQFAHLVVPIVVALA